MNVKDIKIRKGMNKENNIRLLEIWYYDFDNIEKILLSEKIHKKDEI